MRINSPSARLNLQNNEFNSISSLKRSCTQIIIVSFRFSFIFLLEYSQYDLCNASEHIVLLAPQYTDVCICVYSNMRSPVYLFDRKVVVDVV